MVCRAAPPRSRSCPGFLKRWRKDLLLLSHPFQVMSTQMFHLRATRKGEACRCYDLTTKFARQLFKSRRMIDRGANHGEVEAIGCTNVPIADFSQMQGQPEANFGLTHVSARQIALLDLRPYDRGRPQGRSAPCGNLALTLEL